MKPERNRSAANKTLNDQKALRSLSSWQQSLAPALWIPQAACLAWMVNELQAETIRFSVIIVLIAAFFLLWVLRSAIDSHIKLRNLTIAAQAVENARAQAIERFALSAPQALGRPAAGAFASTVSEQAQSILTYQSRYQPAQARTRLVPLLILLVVTPFSWICALILMISAPLIPIFMALVGWRAQAASEKHLAELSDMNAFMLDRLRAMQTLRALHAIEHSAQTIAQRAHNLSRRIMAVLRIAFLSSAVLELFAALGVAMVAVYIGFHLLGELNFGAWGHKLTLAQGLFILMLAPAFYEPLRELAAAWHDRADGQAAQTQIASLADNLQLRPGAQSPETNVMLKDNKAPSVHISHLTFQYPTQSQAVFNNLSLEIGSGEHVALMMPSGGGKTTLLNLIAGLMPYEEGEIRLGTHLQNETNANAIRQRIAWIGQSPHIFEGSLRSNILLGRNIRDDQFLQAIEQSHLSRFLEQRGNVALAEGGAGMSGGELVRLSIARALVDPTADLLLVDEPTAHLDSQTAQAVTDQLMRTAQGRTMLIVTHDPLLASRADRVIDLQALQTTEASEQWEHRL